MVTAGALLYAMRRPLPKKSIAAGWICPPALRRVPRSALTQMLMYAGPICIVLLTKTFIYGERAHSFIPDAGVQGSLHGGQWESACVAAWL